MTDLTAFLLERIGEDEAAARAARPSIPWDELAFHDLAADDVPHIARHDPARVLAQCAALRAVVELHVAIDNYAMPPCQACHDERYPCPTLRALAAIWADHPDYRPEEWA